MKPRHIRAGLWFTVAVLLSGCWAPLEQQDGRLHLLLIDAPPEADRAHVVITSNARRFEARVDLPDDGVVRDFSAIPAGLATVQLTLESEGDAIAMHPAVMVEVVEAETVDVTFEFGQALAQSRIEIVGPGPFGHPAYAGPLFLEVRDLTPQPSRPLQLEASVDGESVTVRETTGDTWRVEVEPDRAPKPWPTELTVFVSACVEGTQMCVSDSLTTTIHRRVWRRSVGRMFRTAGALVSGMRFVVADTDGRIFVFDVETGEVTDGPQLRAEPWRTPAVGAGLIVFSTLQPALVAYDESTLQEVFRTPLTASRPTAPVFNGTEFVVGDGTRLLRVDAQGNAVEIARLPRQVVADPLADPSGVVAADLGGRVVAFDESNTSLFSVDLGTPVYAQPVRSNGGLVIASGEGQLTFLTLQGTEQRPPIDLEAPLAFTPLVSATLGLVVVAGRRLVLIGSGAPTQVELQEPVLGQPTLWFGDAAAVVGLRNGRVVSVGASGTLRELTQLEGAARAPAVLGDDLLLLDSTGTVERLRVEEGFEP